MGFVQERACGRIARQTPRAVEDGERAIRVLVNSHCRLDVVVTVAVGGDLQDAVLIAHRIVVADDPLLLNAEDIREEAGERHERRAGILGSAGERGIMARLAASMVVIPATRNSCGRRF